MNKRTIALILNIAAFVCGSIGIIFRIVRTFDDFFLYYTQISNVVAVISSAIYIAGFRAGDGKFRIFMTYSRYLGACMLTMTFLVVVCIFIPFGTEATTNRLLGSVNGMMHHIVCPVISVVSFIFFERGAREKGAVLIPLGATAVYAAAVYTLNFMRLAKAPYPFFEVYDHPVWELVLWFFGLMGLVTGIAVTVRLLNLKFGYYKNEEASQ